MRDLKHDKITKGVISIERYPADEDIAHLAKKLEMGDSVIIKNALSSEYCSDVVGYLSGLRTTTIPEYQSLNNRTPNHFRINHEDSRSSVKGYFEQFNFFMHNQYLLDLFGEMKHIFELKDICPTPWQKGR